MSPSRKVLHPRSRRRLGRLFLATALVGACCLPALARGRTGPVIVAVDLDPATPGFQTERTVAPGTSRVTDVEIWILDPEEAANLFSIGFVGGLNRGIAFGHTPDAGNQGQVTGITATAVAPVIPGHTAFVNNGIQPLFSGPELQYFEFDSTPGTIPASPAGPVVRLDVELAGATAGDVFRLYLGDMTAVWLSSGGQGPGGAFSSQGLSSLDSGGDSVVDGTATLFGVDPDPAATSPPAAYSVDYIDSGPGGGGAVIRVVGGGAGPRVPSSSIWGLLALGALVALAGCIALRR